MKTIMTIRYVSGREEKFEVELWGGANAQSRLKEIIKSPALLLQVGSELVIIPMSAIECFSVALPKEEKEDFDLTLVRKAKRVK